MKHKTNERTHGKIFIKKNVKERVFEKIERTLSTINAFYEQIDAFRRISKIFERVRTHTCWEATCFYLIERVNSEGVFYRTNAFNLYAFELVRE